MVVRNSCWDFDLGGPITIIIASGAVRLRALVDGHPMVALTCRPYHDKDESRYINATVYDISTKDQYLSVDGSFYVNMYRIHHATFLYFATAQPDILK